MTGQQPFPGERWTFCAAGHAHWGANGGAGLLLRHRAGNGEVGYLLTQRSRWVDEGGTWGIPGGAIRDGETPELAAFREAREEIGELPPYRVSTIDEQDCGGGWMFRIIVADVKRRFDAYCMQETDATGWFTPAQITNLPLHPGFRRWFDDQQWAAGAS